MSHTLAEMVKVPAMPVRHLLMFAGGRSLRSVADTQGCHAQAWLRVTALSIETKDASTRRGVGSIGRARVSPKVPNPKHAINVSTPRSATTKSTK
eukprot:1780359-Amphidinium_carterae.1